MVPGPRPSKGLDRPSAGRGIDRDASEVHAVALTRTARGWTVVSPVGAEPVGDLVEGLSLADLVAEEFGELPEPDRTARRSARGAGSGPQAEDDDDPRLAALERKVTQLEHALAARVSTERAIGVLAERHRASPRAAFESLRREARSSGRPVVELAREVLDGLADESAGAGEGAAASPLPPTPRRSSCSCSPVVVVPDGRS
ncbi:MAG: uncharacterized protein JWQ45_480 [Blastococcus sp.]|nr:uncharacterized protein [Blastococcus sp.]